MGKPKISRIHKFLLTQKATSLFNGKLVIQWNALAMWLRRLHIFKGQPVKIPFIVHLRDVITDPHEVNQALVDDGFRIERKK